MRRLVVKSSLGVIILIGVVQAVSISMHPPAPAVQSSIRSTDRLPAGVKRVVEKACRDCHSNETAWPWYSKLFPVSIMIQRDVRNGRRHLDMSEWATGNLHPTVNQAQEMCDQVSSGAMPPKPYRMMHRDARLSKEDAEQVCMWADQLSGMAAR